MNKLMRRPRPDFTTAFATRKAIATNRTLAFAKPPNAFAGETVPVRTAAPTASIVEVSRGNAPTNTDAIAETKTANKCHAGAVNPSGMGANQIPIASTNGNACFNFTCEWPISVNFPGWERLAARRRAPDPSGPWIGLVLCRPRPPARSAKRTRRSPSRPYNAQSTKEGPEEPVARSCGLTPELAEDLIASLIRP